jgi:LysR family transcriptional regulator of gallate degradation
VTNLRHLHVFREVAALKSVSAASQAVYLSQPAITLAIASLERQFGTLLFKRTNMGMQLTAPGEICLQRVDRALAQIREGIVEISRPLQRERMSPSDLERSITATQLRALIAVVEQGSFSRAARVSNVSQPTLHRPARELERMLGLPLFERTSFGVRPTREAERLARRAKLALWELQQARVEVDALSGGETGRTVIGTMPLARTYLVPMTLIGFSQEFPQHRVSIQEGPYDDLLADLRTGEVDFLVGATRETLSHEDVVQEHLFDDPLAIIVRADHPLVHKKRLTMSLLAKFPWVAPRRSAPLRTHFEELFDGAGIPVPQSAIECSSLVAARSLLLESDRIMLLSEHQAHYELACGMLKALPHPAGRVIRHIAITTRRDWQPTTAQQRLLQLLHAQAEKVQRALVESSRPRARSTA